MNRLENEFRSSDPALTVAARTWVNNVTEALRGDEEKRGLVLKKIKQFDKYKEEAQKSILKESINPLITSARKNPESFMKLLKGLTHAMFITGYIEGQSKQEEVDRLNDLFLK